MANKQINELTEKTTIVDADLIPIYDSEEAGSEKTKKITFANAIGYEEGMWTPVLSDAVSGGNTASMTVADNDYIKIGKQVTVNARLITINTAGMTGANQIYIQGLPFTNNGQFVGSIQVNGITFSDYLIIGVSNSALDVLRILQSNSGGGWQYKLVSSIASGTSYIYFTITYFTS